MVLVQEPYPPGLSDHLPKKNYKKHFNICVKECLAKNRFLVHEKQDKLYTCDG